MRKHKYNKIAKTILKNNFKLVNVLLEVGKSYNINKYIILLIMMAI